MKLLWLCNMAPSMVQEKISGKHTGGLWLDQALAGLLRQGVTLRILCPGDGEEGMLNDRCSYATFPTGLPYEYRTETEEKFVQELRSYCPQVIHIWGTEYAHTLAMVNAARREELLDRLAVSIQGLCSVIAWHYAEGIPDSVRRKATFRDALRRDNILQQQKKFALRGELEEEALQTARHVIGRTHWDAACTARINPKLQYHFCNETLRKPFYEGKWQYETCRKHRVFASSCEYPVKGFHYLLEAFGEVVKQYPDATLAVPGRSFLEPASWKEKLRRSAYQNYLRDLARKYGLEDRIEFLGSLSAEQMRQEYLKANAFVLPSTVENSPNSMGEAMLLGVPCVAADVGGVTTMLTHEKEGLVYRGDAPDMLARNLCRIFAMERQAEALGAAAHEHASRTHDPENNIRDLMGIYQNLCKE